MKDINFRKILPFFGPWTRMGRMGLSFLESHGKALACTCIGEMYRVPLDGLILASMAETGGVQSRQPGCLLPFEPRVDMCCCTHIAQ